MILFLSSTKLEQQVFFKKKLFVNTDYTFFDEDALPLIQLFPYAELECSHFSAKSKK